MLERALDPRERSKLGAHYTPRAYVERLVIPTIIEPLREDWEAVQARVAELDNAKAIEAVKAFHHMLCTTRVLDPACGTGNFLYVSLELMKRLEGEVLEALDALGEDAPKFAMEGETVGPRQFYGLEINPRAVPIADLVLWIGYLKWQLKTSGLASITEPVLDAYGTIVEQDAILAFDKQEMLRDENGKPLSRWDGVTKKLHLITGEEIPDPDATMPLYSYSNPRPAEWPEAEFIVGNPPFIGGKDMRAELGDGYAEAVWKARKHMPGGSDFVMHFWDEAAELLARKDAKKEPNPLRRFGFITTNSITQTFSRRVVEKALSAKEPICLVFAVPDHPWLKANDKAAVRIAMTVAEKGEHEGLLGTVMREEGLNTDTPEVRLDRREGKITAKLTLGADLSKLLELFANCDLGHKGFMPYGKAFWIDRRTAEVFSKDKPSLAASHIKKYMNGRDLNQKTRHRYVLDFHAQSENYVRQNFPQAYQHLLDNSKPIRATDKMKYRRENWWRFGQPSVEMRNALAPLSRFVGTTETAKHRIFSFMDGEALPDQKIRVIASERAELLSVVSSNLHCAFSFETGGWQGVGNDPVYQHTQTLDPFPFPACLTDDSNPALRNRLADLGERLDGHRKERLVEHEFLTMTGMYNVLERVRELEWASRRPISPLEGEMSPEVTERGRAEGAPQNAGASRQPLSASAGASASLPQGERLENDEASPESSTILPLTDKERDIYDAGLISVLKDIHDDIDRATFEAYGWEELGERLVGRPGATMPSPHKSADQEEAEEELLTRLVALNIERQAEEARGLVRWLRPDYQIPKLGHKVSTEQQVEADIAPIAAIGRPKWPNDGLDQFRIVRDVLSKVAAPALPDEIAASFDGKNTAKRKDRVGEVLETLVVTGAARTGQMEGEQRYFLPR